jgi:hypothetical protein
MRTFKCMPLGDVGNCHSPAQVYHGRCLWHAAAQPGAARFVVGIGCKEIMSFVRLDRFALYADTRPHATHPRSRAFYANDNQIMRRNLGPS